MRSYLAAFKYESKVYLFICYYKLNPIFLIILGAEWEENGSGMGAARFLMAIN